MPKRPVTRISFTNDSKFLLRLISALEDDPYIERNRRKRLIANLNACVVDLQQAERRPADARE